MLEYVPQAFGIAFSLNVMIAQAIGTFAGIIIGALPGLGTVLGLVMALPFTYVLDPATAIALLLAIYVSSIYGGSIGKGFGMNVIYHDAYAPKAPDTGPLVPLEALRDTSDVITVHCPLTDETRNLIDLDFMRAMKPTSILINTARGGIIDEEALAKAIHAGEIAGAGIDVVNVEPAPLGSTMMELAKEANVILTPHVAWASVGGMQTLVDQLIDNIEGFAAGAPRNLVT